MIRLPIPIRFEFPPELVDDVRFPNGPAIGLPKGMEGGVIMRPGAIIGGPIMGGPILGPCLLGLIIGGVGIELRIAFEMRLPSPPNPPD